MKTKPKKTTKPKAVQMSLVPMKRCHHDVPKPVLSNGGEVLGSQCSECLELLWAMGECSFCHKRGKLTFIVLTEDRRYCARECRSAELAIITGRA